MNLISPREKNYLEILARNKAFTFTDEEKVWLPYTSGRVGPYYVDSENVMKNGKDYLSVIEDLADFLVIKTKYQNEDYVISGGESKDWFFSSPVASRLGMPHLAIYKNGRNLGADIKGRKVIHIADLNNEGFSIGGWVPKIRKWGGKINDVFFFVERDEEGIQVVEDLGLKSHSLVMLNDDRWEYMLKENVITKEQHASVMDYRKDKIGWGRKMLDSRQGRDILFKMYVNGNESDNQKAKKILKNDFYGEEFMRGLRQSMCVGDI
ncbi:MAG TPA: hypothetical protein VJZ93_03765 [Candidatus Nanoarchaeia archaeon]|nr:hypothetical protein [Candidatus Nanoarchaeia archaeon]